MKKNVPTDRELHAEYIKDILRSAQRELDDLFITITMWHPQYETLKEIRDSVLQAKSEFIDYVDEEDNE